VSHLPSVNASSFVSLADRTTLPDRSTSRPLPEGRERYSQDWLRTSTIVQPTSIVLRLALRASSPVPVPMAIFPPLRPTHLHLTPSSSDGNTRKWQVSTSLGRTLCVTAEFGSPDDEHVPPVSSISASNLRSGTATANLRRNPQRTSPQVNFNVTRP